MVSLLDKTKMASKVFIIAEAGVNHNGDIVIAKRLIDSAKEAGCDAVKFQTFKADKLVSIGTEKAAYQKASDGEKDQLAMLRRLELSETDFSELFDHCQQQGIEFLSTPFEGESFHFLNRLGMRVLKIPSGEITNIPFLKLIASAKKPIILSTGMATLDEVATAVTCIRDAGCHDVTLLHCVTAYPTPVDQVNLRAMLTLQKRFGLAVGYSDHTLGIEVSLAAVAMGAVVIEKHFTLDKDMPGPDHRASLDPIELQALVRAVRNIESAMGSGVKVPALCEMDTIKVIRKSLIAAHDLYPGHILQFDDIALKRPGDGISPVELDQAMGCTVKVRVNKDQVLKWEHLSR